MSRRLGDERGSMLAALMVIVAVTSIMLTVATQQWSFVVRRDKEKELIFRGQRIAAALLEYQASGRPMPTSLEDLTKQPNPVLPAVPHDPMTARYDGRGELVEGTGDWQLIRFGDPLAAGGATPPGTPPAGSTPSPGLTGRPSGPNLVGIVGVSSRSKEESIGAWGRFPASTPYDEWKFDIQRVNAATGAQVGRGFGESGMYEGAPEPPWPPGFGGTRAPGSPSPIGISGPGGPGIDRPGSGPRAR